MYDALPPHSRPRPVLPAANRAQFRDAVPPHTPLAQSPLGPREFCKDASECTAFCTIWLYSPSLHQRGCADWAVGATCTASGGVAHAAQPSRWLTRTIRLGYAIPLARRPPNLSSRKGRLSPSRSWHPLDSCESCVPWG